jgi:hypothetical protein
MADVGVVFGDAGSHDGGGGGGSGGVECGRDESLRDLDDELNEQHGDVTFVRQQPHGDWYALDGDTLLAGEHK